MKTLSVLLTGALLLGANLLAVRLKKAGALPAGTPTPTQPSQYSASSPSSAMFTPERL
jgi:hypothetical protein